jgi:SAM-dependent methyltransferase
MNWKFKSIFFNFVALFSSTISYEIIYFFQRNFGTLRSVNPIRMMEAGNTIVNSIKKNGKSISGSNILEIGTGRMPIAPLVYFLCGANKIVTLDLNPYVKEGLFKDAILFIKNNIDIVHDVIGENLKQDRLDLLTSIATKKSFESLLELMKITYIAPCDAQKVPYEDGYFDFHTSWAVLEHIPRDILKNILLEGGRLLKKDGLFVHHIDYTDHFSHSDKTISAINFLQYSEKEWNKYAGNKFMYTNRLRHDDLISLFSVHSCILNEDLNLYQKFLNVSNVDFQLNSEFKDKSDNILNILNATIVSKNEVAEILK